MGILCSYSQPLYAATAILIDDTTSKINLSKEMDIFSEPDAPENSLIGAKALMSLPLANMFYPVDLSRPESLKGVSGTDQVIWLRFVLENTSNQDQIFWLVLEQYIVPESRLYQMSLAGGQANDLRQVNRYVNQDDQDLFFRVKVPANSTQAFLFAENRIRLANLHMSLVRPNLVMKEKTFEASHLSTTLGMILLLVLLFYGVWIEKKSWLFFYFGNYSFAMLGVLTCSFIIKKSWFLSLKPQLVIAIYIFSFLANTNSLLVIRQYLDNLNCLPTFRNAINTAIGLSGLVYTALLFTSDQYSRYIWLPFLITMPVSFMALWHAYSRFSDKVALTILVSRVVISIPIAFLLFGNSDQLNIFLLVHPVALTTMVVDLLLLGYCFYLTDSRINNHNQQNKQLLQLNEAKHKAQQEVFGQLSQDLRTPISAIIGTSEILKNSSLSDEQLKHIQGIETSAHAVLNKITDIYHRTKSFQESEHLETAPFELHYLIEQCVESFSSDINKRSLELIIDVDSDVDSVVVGHSFFLRTILVELVDNAIKSTAQGHIILRVECVDRSESILRFTIEDTGRGIDGMQLEKIHEPVRLASVAPDEHGINLAKQLLFQLDSSLKVESQIGEGSRVSFDVYLPASKLTISTKALDVSSLESKRLLIIDDNHSYSRVLRMAAKGWGLEATEVYEGAEALALFRAKENLGEAFDAVIIDNDIPNMPAVDVVRKIQDTAELMPAVIMLAGFSDAPSLEVCKDAGIDIVLNKPVSQRLIQSTLVSLVESQQRQQSLMYSRTRVLIAEDNDVSRRVISKMMDLLDVEYKLVSDGKLAVDAMKKDVFDLVLMDCEMPVMNGFDAAEEILAWQDENHQSKTPIYALTAHVFEEHEQRSKQVGMSGFIEKPVQMTELSALIEQHSLL